MWKDAYLESRVMAADPIELVQIVYDYMIGQVKTARRALAAKDIAARGHAISRALAGLGQLEGTLDYEAGGSISRNLVQLYGYMRTKLLEANIRQQDAPLAEVEKLLTTLNEAWHALSAPQATPAVEVKPSAQLWGGQFSPIPEVEAGANAWSA